MMTYSLGPEKLDPHFNWVLWGSTGACTLVTLAILAPQILVLLAIVSLVAILGKAVYEGRFDNPHKVSRYYEIEELSETE